MTRPFTIAVTAIGAIIGQGIAASLRRARFPATVIGIDRSADGIGRHFADRFFAKPSVDENDPAYRAWWIDLCRNEGIDLVLPGLESDVTVFLDHHAELLENGVRVALNDAALIRLAASKSAMASALAAHGLPVIPWTLPTDWEDCRDRLGPPPYILKPIDGNGSRGLAKITDRTDFDYFTAKATSPVMIQKLVGTDREEYTIGAFGLGTGESLAPIIFRRTLSVAGNTQYAEVVDQPILTDAVRQLSAIFRPVGPTNYQFRMDGETPYLLEINPRFSSSTSLRAAFGYNEAELAITFHLLGQTPSAPEIIKGRGWRFAADMIEPCAP